MERLNLQQRQNLEQNAAAGAIDDNCDKKKFSQCPQDVQFILVRESLSQLITISKETHE